MTHAHNDERSTDIVAHQPQHHRTRGWKKQSARHGLQKKCFCSAGSGWNLRLQVDTENNGMRTKLFHKRSGAVSELRAFDITRRDTPTTKYEEAADRRRARKAQASKYSAQKAHSSRLFSTYRYPLHLNYGGGKDDEHRCKIQSSNKKRDQLSGTPVSQFRREKSTLVSRKPMKRKICTRP